MSGIPTRGRTLALSVAVTVALGVFTSHAAAQYGIGTNEQCLQTTNSAGQPTATFTPGQQIRADANPPTNVRCGTPGEQVTISGEQSPAVVLARNVVVNSAGGWSTADSGMRIPADARNGNMTIIAQTRLNNAPVTYSRVITITGAAAAPRRLPVTGRDLVVFGLWGLVLVGFGSVLISATWRRWQESRLDAALAKLAGGDQASPKAPRPEPIDEEFLANLRPAATIAMPRRTRGAAPAEPRHVEPLDFAGEDLAAYEDAPGYEDASSYQEEQPVPAMAAAFSAPADVRASADPIRESVRRATTQTSDVVSRLQEEIRSWSRADD